MSNHNSFGNSDNFSHREESVRWGTIALSSLGTLILSIIAGVAIFYFTNEPPPAPKLYYEQVLPVSYSTDKIQTVFHSFQVSNEGNKEAEELQVLVEFPNEAIIVDQKIEPSGKAAANIQTSTVNTTTLLITSPLINPGETINFAFLLEETTDESIELTVRAKGIIGIPPTADTDSEEPSVTFFFSLGLLIVIQIGLLAFLRRYRGFLKRSTAGESSFNNLGFRFLQRGQIAEAKSYFERSINTDPGPYALGNMAQVLAIEGEIEDALVFCEIAQDYERSDRVRAFLAYCFFCIFLISGKKSQALAYLDEALNLDRKMTVSYFMQNSNVEQWKDDEEISRILQR